MLELRGSRQLHLMHHMLWLLAGVFLVLTIMFVSRITWIVTSQPEIAKPHHAKQKRPHLSKTTPLPTFVSVDDSMHALPIHRIPVKIAVPVQGKAHPITAEHLAAFFNRSEEKLPKTIVPKQIPEDVRNANLFINRLAIPAQAIKTATTQTYSKSLPPLQPPKESTTISASTAGAMPLETRVTLANEYLQQGNFQSALALVNRGLQQNPRYHPLIKLKALLLVEIQQPDAALALLRDNAPSVSTDPDWYAFIAGLYQRQGDHANAIDYYQRVLTERPDRGNWWVGIAISQEALGEKEAAQQSYHRAQEAAISPALAAYVNDRLQTL